MRDEWVPLVGGELAGPRGDCGGCVTGDVINATFERVKLQEQVISCS